MGRGAVLVIVRRWAWPETVARRCWLFGVALRLFGHGWSACLLLEVIPLVTGRAGVAFDTLGEEGVDGTDRDSWLAIG